MTPKLSTTKVKEIGLVACVHSSGVWNPLSVSVLFQVGFEAVVCNFSGLLEAWQSLADFNIFPAIYGYFL